MFRGKSRKKIFFHDFESIHNGYTNNERYKIYTTHPVVVWGVLSERHHLRQQVFSTTLSFYEK